MANHSQHGRGSAVLLLILCGAPFLAALDLLVVNVAFAEVGASFAGHSMADLSWILNAYAITYAALLIPAGRYADRVGHKRLFLIGLGLFTAASAVAAASPSLWALVAARVAQAAGAAAVTPTSLGLLLGAMTAERRAGAVRIWATSGALAAALGPLVGGLLVEASWRWAFLVNLPVGVVLLVAAARVLPSPPTRDHAGALDIAGAALLAVGVGALATALVRGPEWGWTSAGGTIAAIVAGVALAWFARHVSRHADPLLDRAVLRVPGLGWANAATVLFNASFAGGLLALILFLQQVWGYSALQAGLAIAPGPLVVPLFAFVGQRLAQRLTGGVIALLGSLLWAAGMVLIALSVDGRPDYLADVLPGWLVAGVGVGLALPTLLAAATAGLPPSRTATGSALANTSRQIGIVVGVAVLVAVFGTPATGEVLDSFDRAWLALAGIAVLAAIVSPRVALRAVQA
jgi:EmrB/QacA subfamily drug resistance transporter